MENKHEAASEDFDSQDFGDAEDALSLCNLPIDGYENEEISRRSSTSPDQDLFEFFVFGTELSRNNSVVFSGEIIDRTDGHEVKRDNLCLKSASSGYRLAGEDKEFRSVSRNRSSSLRFWSSDLRQSKKFSLAPKVNITAITSMSAKSRRRMFMFGPVKFKPEMDVCAIRKRQSRRPPMKIPPMPEEGEMVTSGGSRGNSGGPGGEGGLLRPLGCMPHLATLLAKSFGCFSASMV